MAERLGSGKKKAAKAKKPKKAKNGAGEQPSLDAGAGEQPKNLKIGRNSVAPETKLKHFNACRVALGAFEKAKAEADALQAEYRGKLKAAKAAGVDKDAITFVLKLKKQEPEEVGANFEAINEMMVLAGMAVPVRKVDSDVTIYATQLGLFPNGDSVAKKVDDKAFEDADPAKQGGNAKVNDTEIASARAQGNIAATKGQGADKNPWKDEDEGHPLRIAWEDARAKKTAEIAAAAFSGKGQGAAAH